jgi:aarF domain-containing kinase
MGCRQDPISYCRDFVPDGHQECKVFLVYFRRFCKVFAPEQVIIFDEIEKQFLTEFDYRAEAKNLARIRKNMKKFKAVVVPEPYLDLCSKSVLTMEFLKGPKLVDGIRENGRKYAALNGKTLEELEKEMRKEIERNGMPLPYNGPSAFTLEIYRNLLKTKDFIINTPLYGINMILGTLHFFTRLSIFQKRIGYYESFIPLNSSYIMDTLLQSHGHQLLIDGFFNADSHPGNFLLMPDGRIGMIDYGQVKQLTDQERKLIARLVLAVANNDHEEIFNTYKETGYKSKYMDKEVMRKMATVTIDRDGRDVTDGLNLQQFIDKMFAQDPWEETSDYLVMPIRLSLLLRGIGLMLNHPVSTATAWKSLAEKALEDLNYNKQ